MELEQKPDQRPLSFLGGDGIGTKLRKAVLHGEPVEPLFPVRFQQLRHLVDGQVVPMPGDQIYIFHGPLLCMAAVRPDIPADLICFLAIDQANNEPCPTEAFENDDIHIVIPESTKTIAQEYSLNN